MRRTPSQLLIAGSEGEMLKKGKVILVGAGPGDPDLLTLRAVQRIGSADVLVYDRLIHESVLELARPSAEKIYMGKPQGHHTRQDEIHVVLAEKAREGKTVVRLKGGDPFLFGRGGEEVEYLAELGIPFEVVPGVSSCLSAPLSADIAVTHRDASSSVVIVTGHNAEGNDDRVDWEAVARIDTRGLSDGRAQHRGHCTQTDGSRPLTADASCHDSDGLLGWRERGHRDA